MEITVLPPSESEIRVEQKDGGGGGDKIEYINAVRKRNHLLTERGKYYIKI